MNLVSLSDFVGGKGQDEAAKSLGSSQAAISKALKARRLIFVSEVSPGAYTALELKGFPGSGPSQKPRPNLEQIVHQIGHLSQTLGMAVCPSSTRGAE